MNKKHYDNHYQGEMAYMIRRLEEKQAEQDEAEPEA